MKLIMGTHSISHLVSDISADFGDATFVWQVVSIVSCFVLAWFLSKQLHKMFARVGESSDVVKLGVESFSRVLWPLLALAFLFLAKFILAKFRLFIL